MPSEVTKAGTALVTGATSGIGLATARLLAERRYDLILVARDGQALARLKAELEALGVEALTLIQDLARPDAWQPIERALAERHLTVDLLVNNAGFGIHGSFAETDLSLELDMVHLQLDSLMGLCKAVLPGMLRRGHGVILNVGSVYSFSPVPFQAVYSACKSFMLSFSLALDNEVRDRGVTVTTLCPGVTRTAFRRRSGKPDKSKGMSAEAVARLGVDGALNFAG